MLEFYPQSSVSEAVNKFNYTGNHYVSNICIKDTLKVQMNKHGQEVKKRSYRKICFTTKDELMCREHFRLHCFFISICCKREKTQKTSKTSIPDSA